MPLEASENLKNINADVRQIPEVLALRVEVYQRLQKWELMQTVAKKLAQFDSQNAQWPISWAYATRRSESMSLPSQSCWRRFNAHQASQ